jgi:hypothetical protein
MTEIGVGNITARSSDKTRGKGKVKNDAESKQ